MEIMKAKSMHGTLLPQVVLEQETDVVKISERHDAPLIELHNFVHTFVQGVDYMAAIEKEEEKDE